MEISNSSIEAIQKAIADHQFKSEFLSNVRQLVPLLNERDAICFNRLPQRLALQH
jgi:hypothetical protein